MASEQPLFEDPSAESEEDIPGHDLEAIRSAVVAGSDWTTETILRQMRVGNIDLNPRFQRRDVWSPKKKSEFVESILLNLPIPQIVLAEKRDDRNTYVVLDGKQRLLALRQFAADADTYEEDEQFEPLQLSRLDVRADLRGRSYRDLEAKADRNAFDNHTIRTVVIRSWPNEDFLYRVFLRLNTGSMALSPQELRQALQPGPFMDYVDEFALDSEPIRSALGIQSADRRMRDTELCIRFLAFTNYLETYTGNLKPFLDDTCARMAQLWDADPQQVKAQLRTCEEAIGATIAVFGERDAFTRWRDGRYERSFNRAVFDVMTFYFRDSEIATAAIGNREQVEAEFRRLCDRDPSFDSAVSSTTKTIGAIAYRITAWGRALAQASGLAVEIPEWLESRAESFTKS